MGKHNPKLSWMKRFIAALKKNIGFSGSYCFESNGEGVVRNDAKKDGEIIDRDDGGNTNPTKQDATVEDSNNRSTMTNNDRESVRFEQQQTATNEAETIEVGGQQQYKMASSSTNYDSSSIMSE